MFEFQLMIGSFQQVQDFVRLAANQPFEIRVGNTWQNINGKDLMGMFSLDYSRPVTVYAEGADEYWGSFRQAAEALCM